MRARNLLIWLVLVGMALGAVARAEEPARKGEGAVTLPNPGSPLVAIRLMVQAGSIDDPKGKEGLAALTGLMVGSAGTAKRTFPELSLALYPLAASIDVATDREVTVFAGKVHRDKLAEYTALLREALLSPGFREADLERNRELLLSYLTTTLRSGSDELLGLEALQGRIYRDHPYATPASGTEQGLRAITMDDVRAFYRDHYTQARLMVGVAGGYPEGFVEELESAMKALPKGDVARTPVPEPKQPEGRTYTLIDKSTGSAGIHLGYPIDVTRKDPDYYPLMVANSWLGEHRTFHGKLMQELRGKRGLNYGDYSYIEHWANPPATSHPTPNRPRREQAFSVWIRPVAPENARFALRAALHFLDEAREEGMTQPELDATREFLTGYSKLWAQTSSQRLGFLMDSRYYGMPSYLEEIEKRLKDLTVEQVNAAIRKYIRTDQYEAVIVTDKAEQLARELKEETPSPIRYNAEPPPGVKDEDEKIIERPVKPTEVRVVPVGEMFEGAGATGAK